MVSQTPQSKRAPRNRLRGRTSETLGSRRHHRAKELLETAARGDASLKRRSQTPQSKRAPRNPLLDGQSQRVSRRHRRAEELLETSDQAVKPVELGRRHHRAEELLETLLGASPASVVVADTTEQKSSGLLPAVGRPHDGLRARCGPTGLVLTTRSVAAVVGVSRAATSQRCVSWPFARERGRR